MARQVNPLDPDSGFPSERKFKQDGSICDLDLTVFSGTDSTKTLEFDTHQQAKHTKLTLQSGPISADTVIQFPSVSGTLLTTTTDNPSFGIVQPVTGTSPTATVSGDTLNLTSGDSSISIAGNSSTKTIDLRSNTTLTIGTLNSQTKSANGAVISSNTLVLQTADATFPGLITAAAQTIAGSKTFSALLNADAGIDRSSSGTLSIGTDSSKSTTINIGNSTATVNIQGSTIFENTQTLTIADPTIVINKGGASGSASNSGVTIEENSSITGYVQTSGDRNSWLLKAPNTAGIATITPGSGGITLAGSITSGTNSGTNTGDQTITLTGDITGSGTGSFSTTYNGVVPINKGGTNNSSAYTAGGVIFSNGTSLTQDSSNFSWDSTNHKLGIGTDSPVQPITIIGTTAAYIYQQATSNFGNVGTFYYNPQVQWFFGNNGGGSSELTALGNGNINWRVTGTGQTQQRDGASIGLSYLTTAPPASGLIVAGNVGIATSSPGAGLDVASTGTSSAIIVPRDTTGNRPTSLVNGMIRYNTSTNQFEFYQNGAWVNYGSSTVALTSAHLFVGSGSNVATDVAVSGDLTLANTGAFTFNTVNSNVGSFGSSTSIPSLTVNGKGLVTSASGNAVIAPAGTVTGTTLASNVVTSYLTTVGTIASGTWNGTTIAIANGGTGQTSKAAAFDALQPMTTGGDIIYGGASGTGTRLANGTNGQVLTSAGTTAAPTWQTPSAGSVTSVAMTVPTFLSISGSPITTSGTLAVSLSGTALPVANGGTATTTAFTQGSVVFAGAAGAYSQDNSKLFWDDTNFRLGIGTASPNTDLDVNGFIEWKGASRVSSTFSKSSDTTLAAITGLTSTLVAGKSYKFELLLYTAGSAGGVKFDLNGGTATATAINGDSYVMDQKTIPVQTEFTALATTLCSTSTVTGGTCHITGLITVNGAGTFIPRFAQNSSSGTASTVSVGSTMILDQIN